MRSRGDCGRCKFEAGDASEWLSAESEVFRYTHWSGVFITYELAENDAWWRTSLQKRSREQRRHQPAHSQASFSASSSPMDYPARFWHLHTSLSTFSNSDAVSEVEIAISCELAQSRCARS